MSKISYKYVFPKIIKNKSKMKTIKILAITLFTAVLCFFLGIKYYRHKASSRAITMILNKEVPQDKVATSVLDYCINNRTKGELDKEILEIQKDSVKVRKMLEKQE